MNFALNPHEGLVQKFNLKAYDKVRIIRKQFIYETTATGLTAQDGSALTDYVVPVALYYVGPKPISVIEDSIGSAPTSNSGFISLVSGKIFDVDSYQNTIRDTGLVKNDFLASYVKTHSGLPDSLMTTLNTLQSERATGAQEFTFGDFTFSALGDAAIKNNIFLYTIPLKDTEGNTIPDAQDYVMITDFSTFGFDHQHIKDLADSVIISFVTGNIYSKDSSNPQPSDYSIEDLWSAYYDNFYNASPAVREIITEIAAGIQSALTAYNNPATGTLLFDAQSAVTETHADEMAPLSVSDSNSVNEEAQPQPAEKSLETRAEQASNNDIDVGTL